MARRKFALVAKTDASQVFAYVFRSDQFRLVESRIEADLARSSHPLTLDVAITLIRKLRATERKQNGKWQDQTPPEL